MDIPTIKAEWKQDSSYIPEHYDHFIRVVDPATGEESIRAVDRATYEAVVEAQMFARLDSLEQESYEDSRDSPVQADEKAASPIHGEVT